VVVRRKRSEKKRKNGERFGVFLIMDSSERGCSTSLQQQGRRDHRYTQKGVEAFTAMKETRS
jgi:hypothetical protein